MKKVLLKISLMLALGFGLAEGNAQTAAIPFGRNTAYPFGLLQKQETVAASAATSKAWYDYWATSFIRDCGGGKSIVVSDYNGQSGYSEGQGYGMLLTAYAGDKARFDNLVRGYFSSTNSHGLMHWNVNCSSNIGQNGATDGDLDAAMALLVANKQWPNTTSPHNYAALATTLINNIKTWEFVTCGALTVQKAGDYLGGCNCTNPSYYATGYYRAFAKHIPGDAVFWTKAADNGLDLLLTARHPTTGLNPAWTDQSGSITNGGTGDCGNIVAAGGGTRNDYQFDAARTPWRMVVDYLWWGTTKAKTYLDKTTIWANTRGIDQIMAGHKLDGSPLQTYSNSSFVGGFAIGAMATTNQTTINNFYKFWIDNSMADRNWASGKKLDDQPYFQNSLRTMYHFVASGNFWNPYSVITANENQSTLESIKFYPNPFSSTLNIEGLNEIEYDITDLSGSIVQSGTATGTIATNFDSGVYFLVIKNRPGSKPVKIVKID